MSGNSQYNYYAGRAAAERQMMAAATDPRAFSSHAELVARYEALASFPSLDLPTRPSASG